MADLSQTPASVLKGTPASADNGVAGEAANAGNGLYLNSTDSKWYKASANATAAAAGSGGAGIALTSAPGAGQPIIVFRYGRVNLGATLTAGEIYCFSPNGAGALAPYSDLGTNHFVTVLGVALNASTLETPNSGIYASGAQVPA